MKKPRNFTKLFITALLFVVAMLGVSPGMVAYADGDIYVAKFYSEGELFCSVDIVDGCYTVPTDVPTCEGKTFIGWSMKGSIGYLKAGQSYSASGDVEVFAVWSAPTEYEAMPPQEEDGWNPDPILLTLIIIAVIVFILLMFVTIWCGVLKRRISELFKFKRKNNK